MGSLIQTIGRILRDFIISILLWIYVALAVFTWHLARMTPEWMVLARVAASVINDLVWMPFGIFLWGLSFTVILRRIGILPARGFFSGISVYLISAVFHVLFMDSAFRFLFIPLLITATYSIHRKITVRHELHVFGRFLPLAIVAVLMVARYQNQMIPNLKKVPKSGTLKVMSYNIFLDGGPEDREKVLATIRGENADIVCCLEFNFLQDGPFFGKELGERYPYMLFSDNPKLHEFGSAIFSKHPIRKHKVDELMRARKKWSSRISIILAEVDVRGKTVNLVSYHLKSVGHFIEYIADKDYTLRWKIGWARERELKYDIEKYIQAQSLIELALDSPGPTILCGDLNDTPNSRVFHLMQKNYTDTFSSRGWGVGATFGESHIREKLGWMPLVPLLARDVIRIDHIFVSGDIRICRSKVISDAHGSDHKPVVAELEIN